MNPATLWLGVALVLACVQEVAAESAADAVTLRDGQVVLGQVVEPAPRGTVQVLVRRAWAVEAVPEWARRWQAAEAPAIRRAEAQRRARLLAWRRERAGTVEPKDAILEWIDHELARLSAPAAPPRTPLLAVRLSRSDVRSVVCRPREVSRMLRRGWLSGFARVEAMSRETLREALEDRGFAGGGESEVGLDRLLPVPTETDAQWVVRRAATEVANDSGLRFLRTGPAILPEPVPGQPLGVGTASSALAELKRLLDAAPTDPLAETLRAVAARGKVGAVVTQLEISPDLTTVRVASTLWIRGPSERWTSSGSRTAAIRPDDLAPDAGKEIGEDPQVRAVFGLVETLGLGAVPDDVKRRSLNVGAATQKALGQVRSAFLEDLAALALPVHDLVEPEVKNRP